MTLRRGLVVALVAAATSMVVPARADPRGRPRHRDVLEERRCGLATLMLTRGRGGPNEASVYVSDRTRRGTRRLGDIPVPLEYASLEGPAAGWMWITGRNVDTGGTSLWFASPSAGVVPGFASVPGARRYVSSFNPRGAFQPTKDGLWFVLDRSIDGLPDAVRFQPFPDSGGEAREWDLPNRDVGEMYVKDDVAVFPTDGLDGAGRELWAIWRDGDRARRVADMNPGEAWSWPIMQILSPPLVVCTEPDGRPSVVNLATRESRSLTDLVGAPGARIGGSFWQGDGAAVVFESDDVNGQEPMILEATADGTTATRIDLAPGTDSSSPGLLLSDPSDGALLLTADDGVHGREVFFLDVPTKEAELFDLVRGPPSSNVNNALTLAGRTIVTGALPSGVECLWLLQGGSASRIDAPADYAIAFGPQLIEARSQGRHQPLFRRTLENTGTKDDAAGLGFTDDVTIACRRWARDADLLSPAANGRARDAGALEVRRLSTKGVSADVEVLLPAPAKGKALSAGTWIVDVGGLVEGDYFGPRGKRGGRGKGRISRSVLRDGRVRVRARVVGGAPRRDGPGGTIPVLVWRDTDRFEGAAAR